MIKTLIFQNHGNNSGSLIAIESARNIPFKIKRIYYLFKNDFKTKKVSHAHKNLKQIYIALSGSCEATFDNGVEKQKLTLNNPEQGILIEGVIWRELSNFSKDCILLVLADDFFKEEDYLRDYQEFLNYISK